MNHPSISLRQLVRHDAVLLVLALLAGIAAAWLASRYLSTRAAATEAEISSRYASSAVVVAAVDLVKGEELHAGRLAVRRMPKQFLPPDAVTAEQAGVLLGGHAAIDIRRGTAITPAAIYVNAIGSGLSELLREGERALTLPVDDVNSQAGRIRVGDQVDLFYRRSESGNSLLTPLLQQVQVLAVGGQFREPASATEERNEAADFSTVTLRMAATDAPRVLLAQQSGDVVLVLRGSSDHTRLAATVRSSRELLHLVQMKGARPPRVELLIGGSGAMTPQRSWLQVGSAPVAAGDST